MRSKILFTLVLILFYLISCSIREEPSFLNIPNDTLQFDIPYTPQVYHIFLHRDESDWDVSIAYPMTLHVIYHYKKGINQAVDTTDLTNYINSNDFNLFFIKNGDIYILDKNNRILKININSGEADTLSLPKFTSYEKVEYWRAFEVQNIMYNDSCALLTPYFIYHLNGPFTEDSARSWNYRSYSGDYFATLCLGDEDSVNIQLVLDNIRNRYIDWNELAPKVPKYDIGPKKILIPTTYHNWVYIVDPEQWQVQDSFKIISSFTDQAIKRPTIDFDKRFDTEPYEGPYVRWARQFMNSSGAIRYIVGIDWPSEKENAYLIQVYNANFDLLDEKILTGDFRHIAYAFFKGQKLYIPIDSEEHLLYEIYHMDN